MGARRRAGGRFRPRPDRPVRDRRLGAEKEKRLTALHGDTIFALSSGLPPAGIAVFRLSGPQAGEVIERLCGRRPEPRRASLREVRDPQTNELIDTGLVLWFPGPASATGEDVAELHLHGGRAVVAAIVRLVTAERGCREAQAGEFTRRAFENGRIDLSQAEGLADLIEAETELQRRAALALSQGALGQRAAQWRSEVLAASALVEAELDFSDEGDVVPDNNYRDFITICLDDVRTWLAAPAIERLKQGISVVVAGPPNAGKSSLINALVGRKLAIVSDLPGTTRDRIEANVAIEGLPFTITDTAGLRDATEAIEAIGVELARSAIETSDIVLWLGDPANAPANAVQIRAKADMANGVGIPVSAKTGQGLVELSALLVARGREIMPFDAGAINERQRQNIADLAHELELATEASESLIGAEHLRRARLAIDRLVGRSDVEAMLDTLFGRLCIGK